MTPGGELGSACLLTPTLAMGRRVKAWKAQGYDD
jgi:hypothetical protein